MQQRTVVPARAAIIRVQHGFAECCWRPLAGRVVTANEFSRFEECAADGQCLGPDVLVEAAARRRAQETPAAQPIRSVHRQSPWTCRRGWPCEANATPPQTARPARLV